MLRKYTPALSLFRTYVRTFTSWKSESGANGGIPRGLIRCMVKATIDTHAAPSSR